MSLRGFARFMMLDEWGRDTAAVGVKGEYALPLRDFLPILRRSWVIILVALVLTGAAVGFSLAQTPRYEASIMILIGQESGITETPDDVMGLQQLGQTMAEAVSSRRSSFHADVFMQIFRVGYRSLMSALGSSVLTALPKEVIR